MIMMTIIALNAIHFSKRAWNHFDLAYFGGNSDFSYTPKNNWSLPSCFKPLFQSEAKYKAIDMKMSFYSHANKTNFLDKGFVPSLVLEVRVFGTRRWPIPPELGRQFQFL